MKIIDLLNKVANGEKVPKKIKFNEDIYTYHDKEHGYCKHHYDNTYICINSEYYLFDILNDEVEIIGEDEKIENTARFQYTMIPEYFKFKEAIKWINNNFEKHQQAINEIIDKLNKGE